MADSAYLGIKQNIFDFRLLPGERFSENEVATRLQVSRTPVREALYRLEREGYLQVQFRSGRAMRERYAKRRKKARPDPIVPWAHCVVGFWIKQDLLHIAARYTIFP